MNNENKKDKLKISKGKKTAVSYVRSAKERSSEDIFNLQAKSIMEHCNSNEFDLVAIFVDNGASGANFKRKGWNCLKNFIESNKGKINVFFVSNADRIGRDFFLVKRKWSLSRMEWVFR